LVLFKKDEMLIRIVIAITLIDKNTKQV